MASPFGLRSDTGAPSPTRMLIATRDGVFLWPGTPLASRRGEGFLLSDRQEIINKIAGFYGPEAIHKPVVQTLVDACDLLWRGDVEKAQIALDRLNLPGISPNGWRLMKTVASRLGLGLPTVSRAERQIGSVWDAEYVDTIARLHDRWHGQAIMLEKFFNPTLNASLSGRREVHQTSCNCGCGQRRIRKYNFQADEIRDQKGRWAAGSSSNAPRRNGEHARIQLAQELVLPELIPRPFPIPFPLARPVPYQPGLEVSPFLDVPQGVPRESIPQNPYPERPECVDEWEQAQEFCQNLKNRKQLGKGRYRYMGTSMWDCMKGQVSEDCGGNILGA